MLIDLNQDSGTNIVKHHLIYDESEIDQIHLSGKSLEVKLFADPPLIKKILNLNFLNISHISEK